MIGNQWATKFHRNDNMEHFWQLAKSSEQQYWHMWRHTQTSVWLHVTPAVPMIPAYVSEDFAFFFIPYCVFHFYPIITILKVTKDNGTRDSLRCLKCQSHLFHVFVILKYNIQKSSSAKTFVIIIYYCNRSRPSLWFSLLNFLFFFSYFLKNCRLFCLI